MKRKNAFTLVEVFIVMTIIGLLAAMLIPAYQKVREGALIRHYENGGKLNKEQMVIVRQYYKNNPKQKTQSLDSEPEYKTIVIDGKTYKLVPQ